MILKLEQDQQYQLELAAYERWLDELPARMSAPGITPKQREAILETSPGNEMDAERRAQARYIERVGKNYATFLEDARKVVRAFDEADFKAYIEMRERVCNDTKAETHFFDVRIVDGQEDSGEESEEPENDIAPQHSIYANNKNRQQVIDYYESLAEPTPENAVTAITEALQLQLQASAVGNFKLGEIAKAIHSRIAQLFNNADVEKSFILNALESNKHSLSYFNADEDPNLEPPAGRKNRTAAKAAGTLEIVPGVLATPSSKKYMQGLSLYRDSNSAAFLQWKGETAELRDLQTNTAITDIDLQLLRSFYSIILDDFKKTGKLRDTIEIFVPKLAEYLGMHSNANDKQISAMINKAKSFHTIAGHIITNFAGKLRESEFPVLNYDGYDAERNTISFNSPYLTRLIKEELENSIVKDKNNLPKLKPNGQPLTLPMHHYLLNPQVYSKVKNHTAIESAIIILNVIAQTGSAGTPNISARSVMMKNQQFLILYGDTPAYNKTKTLQRHFKNTLEILRDWTYLKSKYKNIVLPDPENPANIPTQKTLDSIIYRFPHKGIISADKVES